MDMLCCRVANLDGVRKSVVRHVELGTLSIIIAVTTVAVVRYQMTLTALSTTGRS
jgi:hypothetical protein